MGELGLKAMKLNIKKAPGTRIDPLDADTRDEANAAATLFYLPLRKSQMACHSGDSKKDC